VKTFIQKHAADVIGVLSGFDRLVFRGTARQVGYVEGMRKFLSAKHVLLKDFGSWAEGISKQVKEASLATVTAAGRPVVYLPSARTRKETLARQIAERDRVTDGLICAFTTVEPLRGFDIFRNRAAKKLELVMRERKCLYVYHYLFHPRFGFMHARLQTWFPFQVQVWLNGREWLARELDTAGIGYLRRENCFPMIANVERAQRLMDEQLQMSWPLALDNIRRQVHPAHESVFAPFSVEYYWSVYQSEWATDVMFRNSRVLHRLYDHLVRQGITRFHCHDVLRFLGRSEPAIRHALSARSVAEILSDIKERPEGIRLKHRAGGASVKLYDKQGTVLRVETTINDPDGFKTFRCAEGEVRGVKWRPMRRGIADLRRRAEVSQAVNNRYLEALATFEDSTPLGELAKTVCRPTTWNKRRVRALHPWSPDDLALLEAVSRGEFLINGFRNRDLRAILFPGATNDPNEMRRRSGRVTRKLRLLRAHGLIAKRPRTNRYALTQKGNLVITALIAAHRANTDSLIKMAA
jgi:hypothetical protein